MYFVGTARVQSGGQTGTQSVDATIITGPKQQNYLFLYVAKSAQALQRDRETMLSAERTFRAMTNKDLVLARPWKIRLMPFPAGGFTALAKLSAATLPHAEAQLRLLNGAYPDGVIKAGTQVKFIE